jgi:Mce-associated membrane protein
MSAEDATAVDEGNAIAGSPEEGEARENTEAGASAPAETAAGDGAGSGKRSRIGLPPGASPARIVTAIVIIALLASTACFAYLWAQRGRSQSRASADQASVLAAGKTYAINLSSYNYKNLDANFKTVTAHSTGSFAKQYKTVSGNLTTLISKYKATSTATVIGEAVQSLKGNEAVLLLFVDQKISNTSTKSPQTDSSRMRMTLVRSHGQWLLDNVRLQ